MVNRTSAFWNSFVSLLRLHCPRCNRGRLFKTLFHMNEPCPNCGLYFEREPGYFFGAMYVSYPLAIGILATFYVIGTLLRPEWSPQLVTAVILVPYLPLMPAVFRYSRAIWLYLDRWAAPDDVSSNQGWLQHLQELNRRD